MHGRVISTRSIYSIYRTSLLFTVLAAGLLSFPRILPADSFNWQSVNGSNWNTPVESQFGGTCWDFSACGTLEAKYKLTRNDPNFNDDVSEQQVCWEQTMGTTGGGWGSAVLNYFTSHGVVSAAECPYQSSSPDIGIAPYWPLATGWANRVWKSTSNLNDFVTYDANNPTASINLMKSYLKTSGPLEVGIWASNDLFSSVADIVANYRAPNASSCDHEVSLVGYQDVTDGSIPTGGYWIIKNSWGYSTTGLTDYVNNGYYLIPYGNIEIHNDISAITGAVYYTGPMYRTGLNPGVDHTGTAATMTWTGANSVYWSTSSSYKHNWSNGGADFTWVNQEVQANFPSTATRKAITISGTAIAHGLNISTTGYTFSGGSLTVTNGGIVTTNNLTISSNVYIGAPQSWNVAAGQTLSITGPLHTIISDLTFSGAGTTTISNTIDGGGVLNTVGGAKMGGLIQAGTGMVTLSGITQFSGDITANSGVLNIQPPGAASLTLSGAFSGTGTAATVNINCAGVFTLGAATSNFAGTLNMQQAGTLTFIPAAGVTNTFTGTINTTGPIIQNGPGTTILSGGCAYPTGLTIASGTLALQDVTNATLLAGNFSVGGGTLEFNTVNVDSNYTGVISGSGGLNKSGVKKLTLSGSTGNAYSGDTNITEGSLDLNKTSGYAIPGNLNLMCDKTVFVRLLQNNQIAPSATINVSGIAHPFVELLGHSLTVAGLSDATGLGFIENSDTESGDYSTGVLTIDSAANWVYNGCLRDNSSNGTGKLALVKNGSGTLTLLGNRTGIYTGGLTVNAGTLDYSGGIPPAGNYTVTGGTLNTGANSASIGAFQITGGTVTGTGSLTSSSACDLQNGTVNVGLGGSAGLNKSGSGTVSLTRSLPGGNYAISGGTLNINALSASIGSVANQRRYAQRHRHAHQQRRLRRPSRSGQCQTCGHVDRFEQDGFRRSGPYRGEHVWRHDHGCVRDARVRTGGAERRVQPRRRRHPARSVGVRLQWRNQPGGDDPAIARQQLRWRALGRWQVQGFDRGEQRIDLGLLRQRLEHGDGDGHISRRLQSRRRGEQP